MKFEIVNHLSTDKRHSVAGICKDLGYSRSTYYTRLERYNVDRDIDLKTAIKSIFEDSKCRYGSPRVTAELWSIGYQVGENKVANLMRDMGLRVSNKPSFKPKTTINDPASTKSPRVFKVEDSTIEGPDEVWCSDLTYLPYGNSFLYLVIYLDVFTRKIKSWELSTNMKAGHTKRAFLKAVKQTGGQLNNLIVHSDQGVQYSWSEYRETLKLLKSTQSMSRRGNCYDNAFAESFFATLKRELSWKHCKSEYEVKKEIEEYMKWYNEKRRHSSLGNISPMEFEKKFEALTA